MAIAMTMVGSGARVTPTSEFCIALAEYEAPIRSEHMKESQQGCLPKTHCGPSVSCLARQHSS
eukprot:4679580-Prorocentrum_lima.AAC.1